MSSFFGILRHHGLPHNPELGTQAISESLCLLGCEVKVTLVKLPCARMFTPDNNNYCSYSPSPVIPSEGRPIPQSGKGGRVEEPRGCLLKPCSIKAFSPNCCWLYLHLRSWREYD